MIPLITDPWFIVCVASGLVALSIMGVDRLIHPPTNGHYRTIEKGLDRDSAP